MLSRSHSFGQLTNQRNVTSMLDSQFRHHLENLLNRRSPDDGLPGRNLYHMDGYTREESRSPSDDLSRTPAYREEHRPDNAQLEAIVGALRDEVTTLKNVVNASFDLQLDIQRSIRQEVAAAMSSPARLSWKHEVQETSMCTADTAASPQAGSADCAVTQARVGTVQAGLCTVCLEGKVDSLLYGCGHMCTCASCGRQLLASGLSCPICRAPVRDVVRAYVVTE